MRSEPATISSILDEYLEDLVRLDDEQGPALDAACDRGAPPPPPTRPPARRPAPDHLPMVTDRR